MQRLIDYPELHLQCSKLENEAVKLLKISKPYSFICAGSYANMCADGISDFDGLFILPDQHHDMTQKTFIAKSGTRVDAVALNQHSLSNKLMSKTVACILKDKLLYSPPMIITDDLDVASDIQLGLEHIVSNFIGFLNSFNTQDTPVFFSPLDVVEWCQIQHFLDEPSIRYTIARRISSPQADIVKTIQTKRFQSTMDKLIPVKYDNLYAHVPNNKGGSHYAKCIKQTLKNANLPLWIVARQIFPRLKRFEKTFEHNSPRTKRDMYSKENIMQFVKNGAIGYLNNAQILYHLYNGMFSIQDVNGVLRYQAKPLKRMIKESRVYRLCRHHYRQARINSNQTVYNRVLQKGGLVTLV